MTVLFVLFKAELVVEEGLDRVLVEFLIGAGIVPKDVRWLDPNLMHPFDVDIMVNPN